MHVLHGLIYDLYFCPSHFLIFQLLQTTYFWQKQSEMVDFFNAYFGPYKRTCFRPLRNMRFKIGFWYIFQILPRSYILEFQDKYKFPIEGFICRFRERCENIAKSYYKTHIYFYVFRLDEFCMGLFIISFPPPHFFVITIVTDKI